MSMIPYSDGLLPHITNLYVHYEPFTDQEKDAIRSGKRPVSTIPGTMKLVLEVDHDAEEALRATLGKCDFTPLLETLKPLLEPATCKYAGCTIKDSNLAATHPGMLIDIEGRTCLELSFDLAPENLQRARKLSLNESQNVKDAVMTRLMNRIRNRQEGEQYQLIRPEEKFTRRCDRIQETCEFGLHCIVYYGQDDVPTLLAKAELYKEQRGRSR